MRQIIFRRIREKITTLRIFFFPNKAFLVETYQGFNRNRAQANFFVSILESAVREQKKNQARHD